MTITQTKVLHSNLYIIITVCILNVILLNVEKIHLFHNINYYGPAPFVEVFTSIGWFSAHIRKFLKHLQI